MGSQSDPVSGVARETCGSGARGPERASGEVPVEAGRRDGYGRRDSRCYRDSLRGATAKAVYLIPEIEN